MHGTTIKTTEFHLNHSLYDVIHIRIVLFGLINGIQCQHFMQL